MGDSGILFIVSGPSGAGKTSLCKELLKAAPALFFSVSYTTRSLRKGEIEGTDYFFVSRNRFKEMIKEGAFAEWAEIYGNLYGTTKACIEQSLARNGDLLFDIDPQGAENLKRHYPQSVTVFVLPPSAGELERRLRTRSTDTDEVIEKRLERARQEIDRARDYDYLVTNEDLHAALQVLQSIVTAERHRACRVRKSSSWFTS